MVIENNLQELEFKRDSLQKIIQEAQNALDTAKAKARKTGTYADPDWFVQTKSVIRERTNEVHSINRNIKEIKKNGNINTRINLFQEAAKTLLAKEKYDEINALAESWHK